MGLLLTSEAAAECELGRDVADNCETGSENRNTKCLKAPLDLVLKKHDAAHDDAQCLLANVKLR